MKRHKRARSVSVRIDRNARRVQPDCETAALENRLLLTITNVSTGTTYPTIAAAVAAASAGNTIDVGPGTYNETVNINIPLTIDGAQSGVDARTRSGAAGTESIVDGTGGGFDITANNVTVDGFTFSGVTASNPIGFGVAVANSVSGAQVLNNIFENNIAGLYLNSNGTTQDVVKQNLFENNNNAGPASGNGIYTDSGASNILIDSNAFTGNSNSAILFVGAAGSQSNITITNNQISSNNAGIGLANVSTATISGNTISGATGSGIGLAGGDSGVTITMNSITDSATSAVNISTAIAATPNANVTVNFNRFFGDTTAGVAVGSGAYTAGSNVDATENWWGGNAGPNTTGNDAATGAVTFTPWLVLQATAALSTIGVGGSTAITADLTHDSTGAVASGTGHFPDGVPITFAGTGGTVAPSSAPTSAAMAASVFTSTTAGANSVAVTLDNQTITIAIQASALTLLPTTLPNGDVGQPYSQTVTASGGTGTFTYSVSSGALPAGLSLDTTTGAITGTPTTAGTDAFSITATDTSGATVTNPYSVTVNPAITISPTTLPDATVGTPYSQQITATGGMAPITFAVTTGTLPAGLTLSSAGLLSGTPTTAGTSDFTVTATDAVGATAEQAYTLTVNQAATGPTVTNLQRFGFHDQPTIFVLTFSQPMNPTPAQNVSNYTLVDTTTGATVPLSSAVYNSANNTVTLNPTNLVFLYDQYQLTVNGTSPNGLTNTSGVFLAGMNGQPGTNFVQSFGQEILAGPNTPTTAPAAVATKISSEWTSTLAPRFAAMAARKAAAAARHPVVAIPTRSHVTKPTAIHTKTTAATKPHVVHHATVDAAIRSIAAKHGRNMK